MSSTGYFSGTSAALFPTAADHLVVVADAMNRPNRSSRRQVGEQGRARPSILINRAYFALSDARDSAIADRSQSPGLVRRHHAGAARRAGGGAAASFAVSREPRARAAA